MATPAETTPVTVVDKRRGPKYAILDGEDIATDAFRQLSGTEPKLLVVLTAACRGNANGWSIDRANLAEQCGCSVDSIDRATEGLERLGWIKRIRRCLPKLARNGRPELDADGQLKPGVSVLNVYEIRSPSRIAEYEDADVDIVEIVNQKLFRGMRVLAVIRRGKDQQPLNFPRSGTWGGSRRYAAPPSRTDAAPPSRTDAAPPSRTDAAPGSRTDAAQTEPEQNQNRTRYRTRRNSDPPNPPPEAGGARKPLRADRIRTTRLAEIEDWRNKALVDCRISAEALYAELSTSTEEDIVAHAAYLAREVEERAAQMREQANDAHRRALARRGYREAS